MSQYLGEPICPAAVEDEDFDFVASQQIDGADHFKLCQLKELVPANLNPQAALDQILVELSTYDNPSLIFVIHLNRREYIDFSKLKMLSNRLGGWWLVDVWSIRCISDILGFMGQLFTTSYC